MIQSLDVIILAGGLGTRLRSVVNDLPKPMAPINGVPFLELLLRSLNRQGVARVVLSVGYLAQTIIDYFGTRYQNIELIYELEDTPRGTGGAIAQSLKRIQTDAAIVLNGDTYVELDIQVLGHQWHQHHQPMIVAQYVDDKARYGSLAIDQEFVTGFIEKGRDGAGLINAGCYVLPKSFLNAYQEREQFSLETDVLMPLIAAESHVLRVFETSGLFIDIGVPEDFHRAQTLLST